MHDSTQRETGTSSPAHPSYSGSSTCRPALSSSDTDKLLEPQWTMDWPSKGNANRDQIQMRRLDHRKEDYHRSDAPMLIIRSSSTLRDKTNRPSVLAKYYVEIFKLQQATVPLSSAKRELDNISSTFDPPVTSEQSVWKMKISYKGTETRDLKMWRVGNSNVLKLVLRWPVFASANHILRSHSWIFFCFQRKVPSDSREYSR